jgi:hypothetical protein
VPTAFLRSARPCGPASHASLLATTSLAALLLGAPAHAGQSFTNASVATVTNPSGQATTSIVITGSTVTGAVTNAGTIAPGKATPKGTTAALFVANGTIGGGIVNSGTIDAKGGQTAAGILISGGTVSGGITNTGSINATGNAADGNSFATTLGARATTRISFGDQAVLVPELRLGWSHEFLDASQTLSASLVAVSGSTFSATGINFGRDAALIGAGLSLALSPDAKVFLDYDGKLSQRLQEHSVSGGLKVRF